MNSDNTAPIDEAAVNAQVERICEHPTLSGSMQMQKFLRHVVMETLAGRAHQIDTYSIGVNALGRDKSFSPDTDPIVRVVASGLRKRLEFYYATDGANDSIKVLLPKGRYDPVIKFEQIENSTIKRNRLHKLVSEMVRPHLLFAVLALVLAALFVREKFVHHELGELFYSDTKQASSPRLVIFRPRVSITDPYESGQIDNFYALLYNALANSTYYKSAQSDKIAHERETIITDLKVYHLHVDILLNQ